MADSDAESCGPLVAADDVRRGIFNRPRATGNQEALSDPFFDRPLEDHYEHLPSSYYIDLDVNKAVDVLLHCRILAECAADPDEIHPPSPMCPPCRPSPRSRRFCWKQVQDVSRSACSSHCELR
ncbi:uncharacterized protein [Aegilops tauschii subsp. strangulata]|uniref:Uncharacterized protein n=1 Tax=Aegilops tauschii subsp. strangulata TaxID=200361 RepID=A0A453EEK0_AEGTS|nr:uncharacterized protein LOC109739079 [Aegilops tauschii subsp. strangulata]XP_044356002.1 uncharacterized protein LOC123077747 [Triticum aestivum]XP_045090632.1 uncharacterized protein LOC109739079 [Aegilops tauschii subsp. strangulata]